METRRETRAFESSWAITWTLELTALAQTETDTYLDVQGRESLLHIVVLKFPVATNVGMWWGVCTNVAYIIHTALS